MNKEEAWLDFQKKHPAMLDETLTPQVSKAFETIKNSRILSRFGANANACNNFETLIQIFVKKAFNAGYEAREKESLTNIIEAKKD
jgi:hypothetical protein